MSARHRSGKLIVQGTLMAAALASMACAASPTGQRLSRTESLAGETLKTPEARASRVEPSLDGSAPLERDQVIALAIARSPGLAVLAHRARALVHAGRAEGALPSPELGFEVWNLPLTRPYELGEADMYMVELRQQFPAYGSLDARARAMAAEAEAVLAELAGEERMVVQRASDAFIDYDRAFAERRLRKDQLTLLERMGQATHARHSTGSLGLVDVARLDVESARLRRSLARLDGDIARTRALLNGLLRRSPELSLGEPRAGAAERVALSLEELLARALAHRDTMASAEARLRAAAARREAAEAEARIPEFMVGLGYFQDPKMRPGVGLTASMTLPWLWGPGPHRVAEAEENEAVEEESQRDAQQKIVSEVGEAYAREMAFAEELRVLGSESLPAAERSMNAFATAFSTSQASLLEWVDLSRSVLDLRLEEVELRGELAHSIVALELAVGTGLPRVAIESEKKP